MMRVTEVHRVKYIPYTGSSPDVLVDVSIDQVKSFDRLPSKLWDFIERTSRQEAFGTFFQTMPTIGEDSENT